MIIEMRTYKLKPGKRGEFLEIFRTKSIPAHDEIGMKLLIDPLIHADGGHTLHVARARPKREPVQRMQRALRLVHLPRQGLLVALARKPDDRATN